MRFPQQTNPLRNQILIDRFSNQLDRFRVYSYYHVLGVCNSRNLKNVAQMFEDPTQVKQLLNTPTRKDEFGFRQPSYVGGTADDQKMFYILANGLQDVDIVVESLTTETTVANPKVATGTQALQTLQGEIVIREPMGVKMLNIYRQMCTELNTVPQDVRLIVKTIFVGETDDRGQGGIEYVVDTPAIYATITNFKVSVNEQGSVYTAGLTNVVGGLALDPNLTSSANGQLIRGSGSIKDMLDHLAKQYTEDAANNLKRLPPDIAANKQSVQYSIEIDDRIKQAASWTTTAQRNARGGASGGAQPAVIPANVSLEGGIAFIFESCADYLQQAVSLSPTAFFYKIVAVLDTSPQGVRAVYKIIPNYFTKHDDIIKNMKKASDPESALTDKANVVIYDYIFTGLNTDIESFDMQIDEQSGFFATITSINTVSGSNKSGNEATAGTTPTAAVGTPDSSNTVGMTATVGPGTNSSQQRSANQGLTTLKENFDVVYDRTWSQGAAKTAAIIRTRGHTGWFKQFAINPYEVLDNAKSLLFTDIPDVYLNIMMPSSATGRIASASREQSFERFWFKGLWKVQTITNTFVEGVFTTELTLIAINLNPIVSAPLQEPVSGNPQSENKQDPATVPTSTSSTPFVANSANGKFVLATTTNDTQLTKDFRLGNFTATSQVPVGKNQPTTQDILDNIVNAATVLQYIKDQLKIPIRISSGYRNDVVNRSVGGAANSDHKLGEAIDFTSTAMSPKQLVDAIIAMKLPYKQLILETPPNRTPWVHIAVSRNNSTNNNTTLLFKGGAYLPYKGVA